MSSPHAFPASCWLGVALRLPGKSQWDHEFVGRRLGPRRSAEHHTGDAPSPAPVPWRVCVSVLILAGWLGKRFQPWIGAGGGRVMPGLIAGEKLGRCRAVFGGCRAVLRGCQGSAWGMKGCAQGMQGCARGMQGCAQGMCGAVPGGCGAVPEGHGAVPRGYHGDAAAPLG